jgi:hypothetical protein
MTVYYRSRDVVITGESFRWRVGPARGHRITDLRAVGMTRGAAGGPGIGGASAVALGTGVVAAASWPAVGSTLTAGAALVLALGIGIATIAAHGRGRRHSWELHATIDGVDTVIFSATDEQTFRQVTRGLVRAMEAAAARPAAFEPGAISLLTDSR